MKEFEPIPAVEDAPEELFERGHLWIQELVDGGPLRFRLDGTGVLEFGDDDRVFDPAAVPPEYQHATRHVRERLDREALQSAVGDPSSVVFFGVATYRRRVEYDWRRLPSVLGTDVWSGAREAFLPPDATEQAFEGLGLAPVNALRKEVPAAHFDPGTYDPPPSGWYDGQVLGVVFRNKTGLRAKRLTPDFEDADPAPEPVADAPDPEDLAARYATDGRFQRVVRDLEAADRPVNFEAVRDRTFEAVVREAYPELFEVGGGVDAAALRAAIGERTGRFLG